jgi:hypothetical protein
MYKYNGGYRKRHLYLIFPILATLGNASLQLIGLVSYEAVVFPVGRQREQVGEELPHRVLAADGRSCDVAPRGRIGIVIVVFLIYTGGGCGCRGRKRPRDGDGGGR